MIPGQSAFPVLVFKFAQSYLVCRQISIQKHVVVCSVEGESLGNAELCSVGSLVMFNKRNVQLLSARFFSLGMAE